MSAETKLSDQETVQTADGRCRRVPLSVLVVSADRRFRSVTTVLIARRGNPVATTARADRIGELGERLGVNVVVVDLDEGSPAGAAAVRAARSLRGVGIVLVDEEAAADAGLDEPAPVHGKWGPFPTLYAAIQGAG